jgi:hypothetical protein
MISIDVEGLEEKYRINERIEFSVIIKGVFSGNGFPRVKITNEKDAKDKIYGIAFMSPVPPSSPKYTEQTLHFPQENDPQAPIHAEKAGTYVLSLTYSHR